jgi:hypothetical protein
MVHLVRVYSNIYFLIHLLRAISTFWLFLIMLKMRVLTKYLFSVTSMCDANNKVDFRYYIYISCIPRQINQSKKWPPSIFYMTAYLVIQKQKKLSVLQYFVYAEILKWVNTFKTARHETQASHGLLWHLTSLKMHKLTSRFALIFENL